MGTRSGDVDPSLHNFLHKSLGWDLAKIDNMLNKESGLKGLSGLSNDMRTLAEARQAGHPGAVLAFEVFCYRTAKSLAAMSCALPQLDGLVFTGGIGENSSAVRERTLEHLAVRLQARCRSQRPLHSWCRRRNPGSGQPARHGRADQRGAPDRPRHAGPAGRLSANRQAAIAKPDRPCRRVSALERRGNPAVSALGRVA